MTKLSIIIPAYNEEKTIKTVIDKVKKVKLKNISKEIIIIDNFSEDNTRNILKALKDKSLKIFYHGRNMGKGASIKTGLKNSTGDLILIQDADLEYNPDDYGKLLKPIIENKANVVYGSRIDATRNNPKKMYKLYYIGNIFLTLMTNLLYGAKITDMATGYKVFRKEVVKGINLKANGFDFDPEITAKILKKGYKIYEVPISFVGRKFEEGKKIRWMDGIKAAYYLLKYRCVD
ncbi:MAG: glycosyltransferase family 2 protein [Nanoarchaeota archaeon]|nr:glycosyltransferase family 2 protein [Nanoarchaeota archaeon]